MQCMYPIMQQYLVENGRQAILLRNGVRTEVLYHPRVTVEIIIVIGVRMVHRLKEGSQVALDHINFYIKATFCKNKGI